MYHMPEDDSGGIVGQAPSVLLVHAIVLKRHEEILVLYAALALYCDSCIPVVSARVLYSRASGVDSGL